MDLLRAFAVKGQTALLQRFRLYGDLLFAGRQKGGKKRLLGCEPDTGPKSLYTASLPDRICLLKQTAVGPRCAAQDRL
nr:hypothetical protein [uncultured Pseudodesulfovibrio sp.]